MSTVKKRDYDADLERLKTFIDSNYNNKTAFAVTF